MLLFFLLLSIFPIEENIDNIINPQKQVDIRSFFNRNSISYGIDYDLSYKEKDKNLYKKRFLLSGEYKNDLFFFSFNFNHSKRYLNYKNKDISFLEDNSSNNLELKSGFFLYNFSLIAILNSNNSKITTPGVYLDYHNSYKNVDYKLYYHKFNKIRYEQSKIFNKNDIYILDDNYSNSYNIFGYNLMVNDLLILKFEFKKVSTDNITPKKGFYFEDNIGKDIYKIEAKIDLKNYLIYYNYFLERLDVETKGKKDNRQYFKLIVKKYENSIHKLGVQFKKITNLDISFIYQKFDSYVYGYIKAWPFTDDSNISLLGGKFNFSSKLTFDRYIFEIKNSFKIKKIYKISPHISFDRVVINPNTKTYEGGSLGIGKKNRKDYNDEYIKKYIHLSSLFTITDKNYDLNLYLSQLIPISSSNSTGTTISKKIKQYGGFSFKFFVNFYF